MKKLCLILTGTILTIVNAAAHDFDPQIDVQVAIPQSQINLASSEEVAVNENRVGIAVSTWSPRGISKPSYLSGASEFKQRALPILTGEYLNEFYTSDCLKLQSRWGLSYAQLERSAQGTRQQLNFIAAAVGLEMHSPKTDWKLFSPYLQANLLPAAAMSTRSRLENGSTHAGLFYDLKLGVLTALASVEKARDASHFINLSVGVVGGSLRSSQKFKGFLEGGLQHAF